jgi:hypothetical protein
MYVCVCVTRAIWLAGATTLLNCSLCQAGTYGTGSGQRGAYKWVHGSDGTDDYDDIAQMHYI